jgi:hypothetical protein
VTCLRRDTFELFLQDLIQQKLDQYVGEYLDPTLQERLRYEILYVVDGCLRYEFAPRSLRSHIPLVEMRDAVDVRFTENRVEYDLSRFLDLLYGPRPTPQLQPGVVEIDGQVVGRITAFQLVQERPAPAFELNVQRSGFRAQGESGQTVNVRVNQSGVLVDNQGRRVELNDNGQVRSRPPQETWGRSPVQEMMAQTIEAAGRLQSVERAVNAPDPVREVQGQPQLTQEQRSVLARDLLVYGNAFADEQGRRVDPRDVVVEMPEPEPQRPAPAFQDGPGLEEEWAQQEARRIAEDIDRQIVQDLQTSSDIAVEIQESGQRMMAAMGVPREFVEGSPSTGTEARVRADEFHTRLQQHQQEVQLRFQQQLMEQQANQPVVINLPPEVTPEDVARVREQWSASAAAAGLHHTTEGTFAHLPIRGVAASMTIMNEVSHFTNPELGEPWPEEPRPILGPRRVIEP